MKKLLSSFEICVFAYFIMRGFFVGITINNLILTTKQDGYISIIVGFIIGLIPLLLYLYLINYNHQYNFIDILNAEFEKKVGKIITIFLGLFCLLFSTISFWNLTNLINSQYLANTPTFFIGLIFFIPMIYILSQNINIIGRSSCIFFYFSIILWIIPFLGLIFQIKLINILPLLENGIKPILGGTYQYITNNIFSLFLLTIFPKDIISDKNNVNKRLILSYCLINLILFLTFFTTLSIFGVKLATIYQYPEFHLLKRVSIGGFVQRIESALSIQWIFDMFITSVLSLYYFNNIVLKIFNAHTKKFQTIALLISAISVLIISNYIFSNNTISSIFLRTIFPICITIFFFIIPLITYFKITIKKTKHVS